MSDLPRDPADGGDGEDQELDQTEDLDTEVEDEAEVGDEPAEEVEEEEAEPPPRQTRRTGPRGRANGEEIRELRSQLEATNRQLAEVQRRPAQQFDPAAAQAAEAKFWADLDMMPQAEALKAVYARARGEFQQQLGATQLSTQETLDRQQYDAAARTDPLYRKYRDQVETLVSSERARGNIVSREIALNQVYAQDMRGRASRIVPGQRRAAGARVAAQTTRPATGRGDVARGGARRTPDADDEALLRNTTVGDI